MEEGPVIETTGTAGLRARFEELRARGQEASDQGRLQEALALCERCVELADEMDDQALRDLAFVNRCAVLVFLNRHQGLAGGLREILARSTDPLNRLVAAYYLARVYERRQDVKKGLLYARVASVEYGRWGGEDPKWKAGLHDQLGSFLVIESRFEEAAREYEAALATDPGANEFRQAVSWHNLGYCCLVLGEHARGLELIYRSLRIHRRGGALDRLMQAHLDLCYGHMETGRHSLARRHGTRAVALAERLEEPLGLKNALYLLGEAEHQLGHDDRARECFDRLQRLFPDTPFVTDLLMAVDIRQMINLRA